MSDNETQYNKIYDDLKSLCVKSLSTEISVLDESLVPDSMISETVNELCGALNALCFNFTDELRIKELFEIYVKALQSPVNEVSETAIRCLKHIVSEDKILEGSISTIVSFFFPIFYVEKRNCISQQNYLF